MSCPLPVQLAEDPVPLFSNGAINFKAHDVGWIVCVFFSLNAIAASSWLINKHLSFFYNPSEQRHIVRILFMVPIYSIASFLSYYFYNKSIYFSLVRDCYEAIVISSFFNLLLAYLTSHRPMIAQGSPTPSERAQNLSETFRSVEIDKWMFPLGFVKWRPKGGGIGLLWLMRLGVMQYVVIRPLSTLVSL